MARESKKKMLIGVIKEHLLHSPVVEALFESYGVDINKLYDVNISFGEIESSAITKGGNIIINNAFLLDGFYGDIHYVVHELVHYLQQITGDIEEYPDLDDDRYLNDPFEIEAFNYQVQFMRDQYGDITANEYVEDLLDFHSYTGKEREEKRKRILGE